MDARPIFAIFEGGGAKGVAHTGAIKAVEESGFAFAAVAGSSAGAIVATLIAAGFGADEIFDAEEPNNNLLRRLKTNPVDLFGRQEWKQFKSLYSGRLIRRLLNPKCWIVCCRILRNRGHFSTDNIRELINSILRSRLYDLYAANTSFGSEWSVPERITFHDLDHSRFPGDLVPLKIVATNIRTGGLEIFDRELTPNVEVADAVVASIAIPIIFQPVTMRSRPQDGPYLDGGLVSNLPIWVFSEDKLAWEREWPEDPPVPVVGFSLFERASEVPNGIFGAFIHFLGRVARTALSGSQAVSQQFVEDLEVIRLETDLGVLDFDRPLEDFSLAFLDGKRCAESGLKTAMIMKPDLIQRELHKIVEEIKGRIDARRLERSEAPLAHYRGNLIQMSGRHTLRVRYAVNMDGDADDRLVLDDRSSGAAEAYRERTLVFQDFTNAQAFDFMRKYEKAQVRPTLKGAICVPIFYNEDEWARQQSEDRSEPLGIFCFDSDEDIQIDYNDQGFREFLVKRSAVLRAALAYGENNG